MDVSDGSGRSRHLALTDNEYAALIERLNTVHTAVQRFDDATVTVCPDPVFDSLRDAASNLEQLLQTVLTRP